MANKKTIKFKNVVIKYNVKDIPDELRPCDHEKTKISIGGDYIESAHSKMMLISGVIPFVEEKEVSFLFSLNYNGPDTKLESINRSVYESISYEETTGIRPLFSLIIRKFDPLVVPLVMYLLDFFSVDIVSMIRTKDLTPEEIICYNNFLEVANEHNFVRFRALTKSGRAN